MRPVKRAKAQLTGGQFLDVTILVCHLSGRYLLPTN